jgi:hypothetical protein
LEPARTSAEVDGLAAISTAHSQNGPRKLADSLACLFSNVKKKMFIDLFASTQWRSIYRRTTLPLGRRPSGVADQADAGATDTISIGGHVLHNISAGVAPNDAPPLLGFSVLSQTGRFTIDMNASMLIFG